MPPPQTNTPLLSLQMLSAGVSDSVKRDGLGSSGVEACHNGDRLVFFRSKLKELASWWDKVFTSEQECVTLHINKCETQSIHATVIEHWSDSVKCPNGRSIPESKYCGTLCRFYRITVVFTI